MKINLLIGIAILFLISGCSGYNLGKLEVPVSGAPYKYMDLSRVTVRFPIKVVKDAELSEISNAILEKIAPEIKTFTGEKYKKFSPELKLVKEDENAVSFFFKGEGFVDDISFDKYEISLHYDKKTKEVVVDEKNFGWWGIPLKYKIIAEEIGRKQGGFGKDVPVAFSVWDPNKQGEIIIRFESKILRVNLEKGAVVENE